MDETLVRIHPLQEPQSLSMDEAKGLGAIFTHLTDQLKRELGELEAKISYLPKDSEKVKILQTKSAHLIEKWSEKIKRLGAHPITLNQIKISTQEGYVYWEHLKSTKSH